MEEHIFRAASYNTVYASYGPQNGISDKNNSQISCSTADLEHPLNTGKGIPVLQGEIVSAS